MIAWLPPTENEAEGLLRPGGTPLYKLYKKRVWLLYRFGLKKGIDFDHFGLKSGMVFKGTNV